MRHLSSKQVHVGSSPTRPSKESKMDTDELKQIFDEMVKVITVMDENIRFLTKAFENLSKVALDHKQRIEKLEQNSYDEFH